MSYEIIVYGIGAFVFLILFLYAYIRLKYGFWFYQPVFHSYDFRYYLFPCGVVEAGIPEKNRFTNIQDVKTRLWSDVPEFERTRFVYFIQQHFHRHQDNYYAPRAEDVFPYFEGHTHPCFFSRFKQPVLLQDERNGGMVEDVKSIGVMTSRPLTITQTKNNEKMVVYYVDYLCVDNAYRKKNIAPQVIQTHHYWQRRGNTNSKVSLFKREGTLTGIVPLCVYNSYCFSLETWQRPAALHSKYQWVEANAQNMHLVLGYLQEQSTRFSWFVFPEISNVLELIKSENLFCSFFVCQDEIKAVYFFKRSCMVIAKGKQAFTCIASCHTFDKPAFFVEGFRYALYRHVCERPYFGYVVIENISENGVILDSLLEKRYKPMVISPTAYFFYNFVTPTCPSLKIFLVL